MFLLATMHGVTDERTDGWTGGQTEDIEMPIAVITVCSAL